MILKLNHLKAKAAATTQGVIEAVYGLVEEGLIDQGQFARLQIELDWIQYKHNFREPVLATQGYSPLGDTSALPPIMDVHVDTRQVAPDTLREDMLRALKRTSPDAPQEHDRVPLEEFQSMRTSIVWTFNRFFWRHLLAWEAATGQDYDKALPGGGSDGHNPDAIADDVAEFLDLLCALDAKKILKPDINLLEIGVGNGSRCAQWLDRFQALDRERGTNYYPRVHFHLGDYSHDTLEKAKPNVARHIDQCVFVPLDAINPVGTLPAMRHNILQVHLTNVYDNLPDEEVVRRDGRLYFVEVRSYVPLAEVQRLSTIYHFQVAEFRHRVERMLEEGFDAVGGREAGVPFWQELWNALRLEERLVEPQYLEYPYPKGLNPDLLDDILATAPSDFRFHLSSGALESFTQTLPLLAPPSGYLQVFDIFVTDLAQYRTGFFGPGKLDGSLLNWVNGALLKEVAEREGYDVHFRPYKYRAKSRTSILYTTPKE